MKRGQAKGTAAAAAASAAAAQARDGRGVSAAVEDEGTSMSQYTTGI